MFASEARILRSLHVNDVSVHRSSIGRLARSFTSYYTHKEVPAECDLLLTPHHSVRLVWHEAIPLILSSHRFSHSLLDP